MILQSNEVDAFLATAVEVHSHSGEALQELEVLFLSVFCCDCSVIFSDSIIRLDFVLHQNTVQKLYRDRSTLGCKEMYHPAFSDNFNSSCPIPIIFGTVITE